MFSFVKKKLTSIKNAIKEEIHDFNYVTHSMREAREMAEKRAANIVTSSKILTYLSKLDNEHPKNKGKMYHMRIVHHSFSMFASGEVMIGQLIVKRDKKHNVIDSQIKHGVKWFSHVDKFAEEELAKVNMPQ